MSLRVYNTLSREKEPFVPVTPGLVGIYLCGPTVYKPPHLGHLVGPVIFDAIKRYLVFKGYRVTWVVNITDVDDKIIEEASKREMTFEALAEQQTALYMQVLDELGVKDSIDVFPRASRHMPDIVRIIEQLIAKNHAYATEHGDVWFDTATDADYGKLSNRRLEDQAAGGRQLEGSGKRNPTDFALWKSTKPNEPAWDSPWGRGRPGWHIECSAMSIKYLGETFDIHGGGDDLKFPHHENELAQSECCTGKTFVKYWMHNGLTRIKTKAASGEWKSEKMSKSLGNTMDARELIDTHGPDVIRYLLLSTHYRSPIEFSEEVLSNVKKALAVFTRLFERIDRLGMAPAAGESAIAAPFEQKFIASMDDDFNTAGAIASLHELAGAINGEIEKSQVESNKNPAAIQTVSAAVAKLKSLAQIIGLFTVAQTRRSDDGLADQLMQLIITLRAEARKKKDFATADLVRHGLTAIGITLTDRPDGTGWEKK
ncbi:MAG: cysteine--tRNA ligase [Burkholderiales bacterium]|nr:cysteine--tRNA ligase [Phycisphaerae bacterium]